ncbi:MAG: dihydrofolate reductase [Parachlamydiales bacterium]
MRYLTTICRAPWTIGHNQGFKEALPLAHCIHLTEIHAQVDGDTFFHFDRRGWEEVSRIRHEADSKNPYPYSFVELRPQAVTPSARGKW